MATSPTPFAEQAKKLSLPLLIVSLISGAGVMSILSRLVSAQPKQVLDLMGNWGPLFVFGLVLMWMGDRRTAELIDVTRKNAESQQKMADAVQTIAQKDDSRARELELVIGHLSRNSEKTIEHLVEMKASQSDMREQIEAIKAEAQK